MPHSFPGVVSKGTDQRKEENIQFVLRTKVCNQPLSPPYITCRFTRCTSSRKAVSKKLRSLSWFYKGGGDVWLLTPTSTFFRWKLLDGRPNDRVHVSLPEDYMFKMIKHLIRIIFIRLFFVNLKSSKCYLYW